MSLFEDSRFRWRETYFVFCDSKARPTTHDVRKVLSELGGWKNPQTILICYQHPDPDQLREALKGRRRASNQD